MKALITKETRTRGSIKGQNTNFFNMLRFEFEETKPKMSIRKYNSKIRELEYKAIRQEHKIDCLKSKNEHLEDRLTNNLETMIEQSNTIDRLVLMCEAFKQGNVGLKIPDINITQNNNKNDRIDCSICLNRIHYKSPVYRTECNHMFHSHCALMFILSGDRDDINCPNCRHKLEIN